VEVPPNRGHGFLYKTCAIHGSSLTRFEMAFAGLKRERKASASSTKRAGASTAHCFPASPVRHTWEALCPPHALHHACDTSRAIPPINGQGALRLSGSGASQGGKDAVYSRQTAPYREVNVGIWRARTGRRKQTGDSDSDSDMLAVTHSRVRAGSAGAI